LDSTAPSVVAHIVAVILHAVLVNIVEVCRYVCYGAIVIETPVIPITTIVTKAGIPEAVIDAAVVTDVGAPVTRVEEIDAIVKAPPRWSPERTDVRRQNPCSGNPVVAATRVGPITRRPNVIIARSGRLAVLRERRRGLGGLGLLVCRGLIVTLIVGWRTVVFRRRGSIALGRGRHWRRLLRFRRSKITAGWIAAGNICRVSSRLIRGVLRGWVLRLAAAQKTGA